MANPFLAGGGAVDLVDLDEVVWSLPPEREEAGSPNVLGAVALATAARELPGVGWERIRHRDAALARALRAGLSAIPGVRLLGPGPGVDTLPIATFVVDGVAHALVAARLSAELGVGVRHGCFCAHPYLLRLLDLVPDQLARFRAAARRHDRRLLPGAVRASAGISTTTSDLERLFEGVAAISSTPPPVEYVADPRSGDYWPATLARPDAALAPASGCHRGSVPIGACGSARMTTPTRLDPRRQIRARLTRTTTDVAARRARMYCATPATKIGA